MTVWRLGLVALVGVTCALPLACGDDDEGAGSEDGSGGSAASGATAAGGTGGGSAASGATAAGGTEGGSGGTSAGGSPAPGGSGGTTGEGGATGAAGGAGGQGPLPASPRGSSSFEITSGGCGVEADSLFTIPWEPSEVTTSTLRPRCAAWFASMTIRSSASSFGRRLYWLTIHPRVPASGF